MKFVAVIEYIGDATLVAEARPHHREYLGTLKARGQLVASGPFTDGSGALIIYEAASAPEAERMLLDDPFQQRGVFSAYSLRPWNPVMGNRDLFPPSWSQPPG